jgi:Zn-dependent peptidase ImmA (M78 family)
MRSWEIRINNARRAANQLLRRFGVESAADVNVAGFAQRLGLHLIDAPLDGATAQLVVGSDHASIILSDRLLDPGQRCWAIAHELGHYVLEHPAPPAETLCGPRPAPFLSEGPDDEMEADSFALTLLTPEPIVRTLCDVAPMTLDPAMHLARTCSVSLEASAIRIAELTTHACAIVASNRNGILWAAPSSQFVRVFGLALVPGRQVDCPSTAVRHLSGEVIQYVADLVPCDAWLDVANEPPLIEHSLPASTPGGMLTMLWAPHRDPRPQSPRMLRAKPRGAQVRRA